MQGRFPMCNLSVLGCGVWGLGWLQVESGKVVRSINKGNVRRAPFGEQTASQEIRLHQSLVLPQIPLPHSLRLSYRGLPLKCRTFLQDNQQELPEWVWRARPIKWHWSNQGSIKYKTKWSHLCQLKWLLVSHDTLV